MTQTHEKVGFVGIGLMGHGMAKNIVEKGYPLSVVAHRKRAAVDDLVSRGAVEAASLEGLARGCSVIFLCLTGSPEVAAAVAALKPGLAKGAVVVDCSTSDPTVSLRLAAELAEIGVGFADAPLSRTPKDAWAVTLDCMVGPAPPVLHECRPFTNRRRPVDPIGGGVTADGAPQGCASRHRCRTAIPVLRSPVARCWSGCQVRGPKS